MFFSKTFTYLAILSGAASYVAAEGCFTSGQEGSCGGFADQFFNDASPGGSLIPNERRTRWTTVTGDLRALNTGSSSALINKGDVESAGDQADGCDRGGIFTVGGIQYTFDPNAGTC